MRRGRHVRCQCLSALSRRTVSSVTEQTGRACQAINCGIVCPQPCAGAVIAEPTWIV